jgi:hypothetical protein
MRLPIAIAASLLFSLGLSVPVMSQVPLQVKQAGQNTAQNTRELNRNRQLWNSKNILNYRYTYSNGCFCIPEARGPVVIEVRNGVTTSITSVATGQPVSNPEFFERYNTIPKLFDVVGEAIAQKADRIDARYDGQFGYPIQINIDYSFQQADEEVFISIENFQVIP